MKILIIEDEKALAESMATYLSAEQYFCEFAETFDDAMYKAETFHYDCILLDLMLPGGDGMKILEALKADNKEDGVIIISAKGALEDKIRGLQIGADDYLSKPFHLPELAARIHSLIRRKSFGNNNLFRQNELTIDLLAKTVTVNDAKVVLTKKEYELLLYFISNKNRVVSKTALAEHLSGDVAGILDNYDFLYAHIKNLKKKLTEAGADNYLKTIYGTGYKWQS
ncbi:response regulator transcription factor [Ferruginibacter sp. HRS2-29]|uniref:response regulator transcription factor n=1 Tax=Ferruginibacter sp. HRS2-29 TaxID=2487334 RepID=UPI0020CC6645|nr:response regulator transcription factor [Ferruginibacter sp. HRS2-29]MCP9752472.1 DNA-binding response regulator [Ferruginibacter sp. HRS2-29]